jgi:uncharacterized membrane protein (UPF0127 family)
MSTVCVLMLPLGAWGVTRWCNTWMKRYAIVATLAVLALGALVVACGSDDKVPEAASPAPASDRVEIALGGTVVGAEVADDDPERARGLGGRDRLARDAGMYFVLTNDRPRFWMKGMRFPLDMIWIKDARVVDITADVPHEPRGTPDSKLPSYSPSRPADRVLEVNAGWAKRNGVRPGDRVLYIR